jgi:WD40 repeat protein
MAITLNNDGSLLATTSNQGTIIRIYQTNNLSLIQELRRGSQASEIFSLAFNYNSKYLACSSSKGTIHVFCIKNEQNETQNQKSMIGSFFGFLGFNSQYLNSEWSFAQYHLNLKTKSVIAFKTLSLNNIIVLTYDGKYKLGVFDEKAGGEFSTSLSKNFLKLEIQNDDDE